MAAAAATVRDCSPPRCEHVSCRQPPADAVFSAIGQLEGVTSPLPNTTFAASELTSPLSKRSAVRVACLTSTGVPRGRIRGATLLRTQRAIDDPRLPGSRLVARKLNWALRQEVDNMPAVSLEDARRVIAAAERKAADIGQPMNIAVADDGGNLVSHVRMDGAWIGSIDISINKAYTSRAFDIATKDLAAHSQSGGQFFGIHVSNHGRIMIFAGGIPLRKAGKVVGAIGVSGGSGEQDHAVAEAGAAAF